MVGKFAKSKAGHDKDQIYVILKEDAEYVYLVDGKLKTIEKPKKKKSPAKKKKGEKDGEVQAK